MNTPNLLNNILYSPKKQPLQQQVSKVVASFAEAASDQLLERARKEALIWIAKRAGHLPTQAWSGKSFEVDAAGSPASAVCLPGQHYWVARLNDPDKKVPGRIWSTEITIASNGNSSTMLGVRLMVSSRGKGAEFEPSIPGIVRKLSQVTTLSQDGILLSDAPWIIDSYDALKVLAELIQNQQRIKPVYVISLEKHMIDPREAVIDVNALTRKCLGIAHVVIINHNYTFVLSDLLGKKYSVFNGAVRTYLPGFAIGETFPEEHPVALKNTIQNWGANGHHDFTRFLIKKAADNSLTKIAEAMLPRLSTVKALHRQILSKPSTQDNTNERNVINCLSNELSELRDDVSTWEEVAKEAETQKNIANEAYNEANAETKRLRARIISLENHIAAISGNDILDKIDFPDTLDELGDWANEHLVGKVVLTKRALRAAKGLRYDNVKLVYQSLLLLGSEYRKMKQGLLERSSFNSALEVLGIEAKQCFRTGEAAAKAYGDEYYVLYRGENHYLELHLKNKTNTRDPLRCMRIYFFWDAEQLQVIVGHLPSHLTMEAS